jgi:sulfatase modifying factor 1
VADYSWLRAECGPAGDAGAHLRLARELWSAGDLHTAATAYDRVYGLRPDWPEAAEERRQLLHRLSVAEHGLAWRYVPAGSFIMGSNTGEPDERPAHPVELSHFWMAEAPISWTDFCRLLEWKLPPDGLPENPAAAMEGHQRFWMMAAKQIRLQYCENETTRARDWHAHLPDLDPKWREHMALPPRSNPSAPWGWDLKPMVAASWFEAIDLGKALTTEDVRFRLPTEAEWEKAARGGFIGKTYPWGDVPPSTSNCDFDRFQEFSILQSRSFPANGYGLYAMSGGVWEWTSDWYDAEAYRSVNGAHPPSGMGGNERVVRGGSWTDPADAVTVTFRMSRRPDSRREDYVAPTPNIGFRLVRCEAGKG